MPLLLLLWGGAQKAFFAILEFCSKPPGSWIAAALGLVLCGCVIHHHGYKQGRGACEAEHAEAAANELARQKTAIEAVTSRASVRSAKSEAVNTKNKVIVRVIHDQAAAMPDHDATCIPADIADRLREIH